MPFLLKKLRKESANKNKYTLYLSYALGEILLLVVGILIAFQIDKLTREEKLKQEELESYQLIISDLKRDSIIFNSYQRTYNMYLDCYFEVNKMRKGEGSFESIVPDFLVSNVQFNPVTQNNHQATIEKLRNNAIREQINNYFANLDKVKQATEEFNTFVVEESRPYFLKEHNVFKNDVIFDYDDRSFPPLIGASGIDTVKLRSIASHPYFIPIVSQLRMSIGFYLASLRQSQERNHALIEILKSSLE